MNGTRAITLTTDFGLKDGYVAAMKAVILNIAGDLPLIDVTHLIPAHNIASGAYVLHSTYRHFPPGSVHLAVVDPGVGSRRAILAMRCEGHLFVAPDNGLLSFLYRNPDAVVRTLTDPGRWCPRPSSTFHGRDIFAPLAAHLAKGMPLESVGPRCRPRPEPWAEPLRNGDSLRGRIIHIDHFGNAVSNIRKEHLEALPDCVAVVVTLVGGPPLPLKVTYTDAAPGEPLALVGSADHLEIAVNQGRADHLLNLAPGAPIEVSVR